MEKVHVLALAIMAILFALAPSFTRAEKVSDFVQCRDDSGDAAIAACTRFLKDKRRKPEKRAKAYVLRGLEWRKKGEHDKAIADFRQAASLVPASSRSRRMLRPAGKNVPAPNFRLEDLNGKVWQLSDLRGKVVVVNFCADVARSFCSPELLMLQKLWRKLGNHDVEMFVIDVSDSKERARAYYRKLSLNLPVLHDPSKKTIISWGIPVVPATFVVDAKGKIAYITFGGLENKWLDPERIRFIISLLPSNDQLRNKGRK